MTGLRAGHPVFWIPTSPDVLDNDKAALAQARERCPHLDALAGHVTVRNDLTLPWSSGAVEGNNCKINHIERIMYGRANFDLLRKMTILN